MRVEDGNALGRRVVGQTVTLDLSAARIGTADRDGDGALTPSDLLSGERVSVSVRLARDADALTALLQMRRLSVWRAPADACWLQRLRVGSHRVRVMSVEVV